MKISEMIKELEKIKEEYGDVDVMCGDDNSFVYCLDPVERIVRYDAILQEEVVEAEYLHIDYLSEEERSVRYYDENDVLDRRIVVKIC